MSMPVIECGFPKRRTDTGVVSTGPCHLLGFYVASTNVGTVIIEDGGVALCAAITPAVGFHGFPAVIGTALSVTIGGTALDVTFFFSAGH